MKKCTYCRTDIEDGALLCQECKSHQQPWRNNMFFGAGVAGFLTLIASGLSFVGNQVYHAYQQVFWTDDANVLELETGSSPYLKVTLANGGDGPVFASQLVIYWEGGSLPFPLYRTLAAAEVAQLNTLASADAVSAMNKFVDYVANSTGVPSAKLLAQASIPSSARPQPCFLMSVFDENSSDLSRMKKFYVEAGRKMVTGNATARLIFFSVRTGKRLEKSIPVVATFAKSKSPDCFSASLEE